MTQIKVMILLLFISPTTQAHPDTMIKNFSFHQYDQQGKLVQTLQSKDVLHQTNEQQYHLKQPYVKIFRPGNKTPITIKAHDAQALQDGSQVHLQHHVNIQQDGQLTTENIMLYPQKKLAETKQKIHIQRPSGDDITATGMVALLSENQVHFLKDVNALLTPEGKAPIHASARQMHYEGKKNLLTLAGHAKVAQNGNVFKAPRIHYNLKKQSIETQLDKNKQTEIVLEDFTLPLHSPST
jgi:LPS export ABC transporter protein LptC